MKLKKNIHEADEGGYWAEVPSRGSCLWQPGSETGAVKIHHETGGNL
jgi:hypothetical protein